jgi:hypothetical protein
MSKQIMNRTIALEEAQRIEHSFTQRIRELEDEAKKRSHACTAFAAGEVAKVERWYQDKLGLLKKDLRDALSREGVLHKKKIAEVKRAHQSELKKIDNSFGELRNELRAEKSEKLKPIEAYLQASQKEVIEWHSGEKASASKERDTELRGLEEDAQEQAEGGQG